MNVLDDILPILFSVIVGGIIEIEREYQLKSAGLRTMILVTLGACIFTMLSMNLGESVVRTVLQPILSWESVLWEPG